MKPFQPPNPAYAKAARLITNAEDHNATKGPLHFHCANGRTYCGLDMESEEASGNPVSCTQIYIYNPESKFYAAEQHDYEKLCKVCVPFVEQFIKP